MKRSSQQKNIGGSYIEEEGEKPYKVNKGVETEPPQQTVTSFIDVNRILDNLQAEIIGGANNSNRQQPNMPSTWEIATPQDEGVNDFQQPLMTSTPKPSTPVTSASIPPELNTVILNTRVLVRILTAKTGTPYLRLEVRKPEGERTH